MQIKPYKCFDSEIYDALYVVALDGAAKLSDSRCTHPHVCGRDICMGAGDDGLQDAGNRYDLVSVYLLVEAVLRNYNAPEAYVSLLNWNQNRQRCIACGAIATTACDTCNDSICDECVIECSNCGDTVCTECVQKCSKCKQFICPSCNNSPTHDFSVCPDCV